jgi:DNA-binding NtrC family response regulator
VERAVALCRQDRIDLADLPEPIQQAAARSMPSARPSAGEPGNRLAAARKLGEREKITEVLKLHQNNRTKVAEALGISRRGLYKKLHLHGLLSPRLASQDTAVCAH